MRRERLCPFWLGAGFAMAVLGMSAVIGLVDRVPVFPQDAVAPEVAKGLTVKVVNLLSTGKLRAGQLQATVKKVQEIRGTLTALSTAALSAYTGLQSFFGRGG